MEEIIARNKNDFKSYKLFSVITAIITVVTLLLLWFLPIFSLGKDASNFAKLTSGLIDAGGGDSKKLFAELGINTDGTFSMFNDWIMCFKAIGNGGAGYNTLCGVMICGMFVAILVIFVVKIIKMITMDKNAFNTALYDYCLILKKKDKTKKDKVAKKIENKAAGKVGGGNNVLGFILSPLILLIYALGMAKVLSNSIEKFEQVTPMVWAGGVNFGCIIPLVLLIVVGIVFASIQAKYQKKIIAVVEDKVEVVEEEKEAEEQTEAQA